MHQCYFIIKHQTSNIKHQTSNIKCLCLCLLIFFLPLFGWDNDLKKDKLAKASQYNDIAANLFIQLARFGDQKPYFGFVVPKINQISSVNYKSLLAGIQKLQELSSAAHNVGYAPLPALSLFEAGEYQPVKASDFTHIRSIIEAAQKQKITKRFEATGGYQYFTTPIETTYNITVVGANGGNSINNGKTNLGFLGCKKSTQVKLNAKTKLTIAVGTKGQDSINSRVGGAAGWQGQLTFSDGSIYSGHIAGGNGGTGSRGDGNGGGGGGGASFIYYDGSGWIVSTGGGGAGGDGGGGDSGGQGGSRNSGGRGGSVGSAVGGAGGTAKNINGETGKKTDNDILSGGGGGFDNGWGGAGWIRWINDHSIERDGSRGGAGEIEGAGGGGGACFGGAESIACGGNGGNGYFRTGGGGGGCGGTNHDNGGNGGSIIYNDINGASSQYGGGGGGSGGRGGGGNQYDLEDNDNPDGNGYIIIEY